MTEAAVIGSPISHSRSPAIFSFLSERMGKKDFHYSATEVTAAELVRFIAQVRANDNFVGLNVTIPHKEKILHELDEVSEEARAVGAVNVVRKEKTKLRGFNTDVLGILKSLYGLSLSKKNVLLLGAGGAARAGAFALAKSGVATVFNFNRSHPKSIELCREMAKIFPRTDFVALKTVAELKMELALVINSTPLGMRSFHGTPGDFFDSLRTLRFSKGATGFDMVYQPERTPFLKLARELGLHTIGGLEMLVCQALGTWELWFGEISQSTSIKKELMEDLRKSARSPQPIFLTGFMGVGKSTIAQHLAAQLGWQAVDTDQLIEQRAGVTVAEIFARDGESAFRKLEKSVVAETTHLKETIVSLGGGALVNPESFQIARKSGRIIFLHAAPHTLVTRLASSKLKRPLLDGLSLSEKLAKIEALYRERIAVYQTAEFKFETDDVTPEKLAELITEAVFEEVH